jgi:hypothetical protein
MKVEVIMIQNKVCDTLFSVCLQLDKEDLSGIVKPSFFLSKLIISQLLPRVTELKASTSQTRAMFKLFTSLC